MDKPAAADIADKDEYAGEKIKNTADKAGVIGAIVALILGFYIWYNVPEPMGFIVGFVLASAGIAASCVLVSLLYSYGDIISKPVEQTKIIELEPEKTTEIPQPDDSGAQQQPAPEAAAIDQNAPTVPGQAETVFVDTESSTAEAAAVEIKKKKSDVPSQAYEYDQSKRIAHFKERSRYGVICPVCRKLQTQDNDICFRCSCEFIFSDERTGRKGRTV